MSDDERQKLSVCDEVLVHFGGGGLPGAPLGGGGRGGMFFPSTGLEVNQVIRKYSHVRNAYLKQLGSQIM